MLSVMQLHLRYNHWLAGFERLRLEDGDAAVEALKQKVLAGLKLKLPGNLRMAQRQCKYRGQ